MIRRFAPNRKEAIKEQIERLTKVGFIQEVDHPEWPTNPNMVQNSNGKWRMCVDFTDLNKDYPKDTFSLPWIDQIVDLTSSCDYLSLLDAYSGYHHVSMNLEDEEKTSFITPFGVFCYIKIPDWRMLVPHTNEECR